MIRKFLFTIYLFLALPSLSQSGPMVEKIIDFETNEAVFIVTQEFMLHMKSGDTVLVEWNIHPERTGFIIDDFVLIFPEGFEGNLRKSILTFYLEDGQQIPLPASYFMEELPALFFTLSPTQKRTISCSPLKTITLSSSKQTYHFFDLSGRNKHFMQQLFEEEQNTIYSPVNWLNPYYYDE